MWCWCGAGVVVVGGGGEGGREECTGHAMRDESLARAQNETRLREQQRGSRGPSARGTSTTREFGRTRTRITGMRGRRISI